MVYYSQYDGIVKSAGGLIRFAPAGRDFCPKTANEAGCVFIRCLRDNEFQHPQHGNPRVHNQFNSAFGHFKNTPKQPLR